MTKQKSINSNRKSIPWVRISILIFAASFFLAGTILWILSSEHIINGNWSTILSVLFTALGILFALCQWLFPFPLGESKVATDDVPTAMIVSSPLQDIKKQWLEEGDAHFSTGNYSRALSTYEKVLELDPKCAEAYSGKGQVLIKNSQFQEALSAFEKALDFDPSNYIAYIGKGHVLLMLDHTSSEKILTSYEIAAGLLKLPERSTTEEPSFNSIKKYFENTQENLNLAVGAYSDPGLKRKHKPNEDSLFAMLGSNTHSPQQFGLFIIADGMGGHANGQDASRLAVQKIIDHIIPRISTRTTLDDESCRNLLVEGVQQANLAVHQHNLEEHSDMATTMNAALVVSSTAYIANVGDSRTYLYREPEGLRKLTHDHSVVASLVDAGIIKPGDIYTHPKRNQIYRSLGEKPVVDVDSFIQPLQSNDILLLCSDGLWNIVRDPDIQRLISIPVPNPTQMGRNLIQAALDSGGEDNVSVIIVSITQGTNYINMSGIQVIAKPDSVKIPDIPSGFN